MAEVALFPKQDEFIFAGEKFSGYGGGFGNGKTMSGCIKANKHCTENPGAFFLIGRKHATDLRDSTLRDFLQWFGQYGKYQAGTNSFKYPNGSEIIFRHLDDLGSLTNMNLSGFWIDQAEEVDEEAFNFLIGRLRRPVQRREGFITFNMNGHDWIWRRFKKKLDITGEALPNANDYRLIEASTLENKDNLPEDYVASLLAMPDEYVKRFVYGSWDVFAGQIFDEFSRKIHCVKPFMIPNSWERLRAIDHGQNNPTACLWAAVDYDNNIWIYQEYYQPSTVVSKHVENIKNMSRIRTTNGDLLEDAYSYTVIDPSTHAKTREKNGHLFSIADEYMEAGIPTVKGQNDVIAGINRLKEYLKIRPERMHPMLNEDGEPVKGSPRLFIFETCTNLIEELQQYRWKPQKYGAEEDPKEAPLKKDDHAVDALRYLIMSRPLPPEHLIGIEQWVLSDPMELARRAKQLGVTVNDLVAEKHKFSQSVRHTNKLDVLI